jgi:hypothetical protein
MPCVGTSFLTYGFKSTPASAGMSLRNMPDRLADTINVSDWMPVGATGDQTTNIQAAINACIANGGGTIYFPTNLTSWTTGTLTCGSSTQNVGVIFRGASKRGSLLLGFSSSFTLSSGGMTFDCIERIEHLTITNSNTTVGTGAIQVTRDAVMIMGVAVGGAVGIDASQAKGAGIYDCTSDAGATQGGQPAATLNPGAPAGFVGYYLGQGVIQDCRCVGADVAYALSSPTYDAVFGPLSGTSVIACSAEVNRLGMRIGWGPGNTLVPQTLGTNPFTTVSGSSTVTVAHTAHGAHIGDWATLSGSSTFNNVTMTGIFIIVSIVNANSYTVTATTTASGSGSGGGSTVTYTYETPAIGVVIDGFQTERCNVGLEIYNCTAGTLSGTALTGGIGHPGPTLPSIWALSWAGGTATLVNGNTQTDNSGTPLPTGSGAHLLSTNTFRRPDADGTFRVQINAPQSWQPGGNGLTHATIVDSVTFSYPLGSAGATFTSGSSVGDWNFPNEWSMRIRVCRETVIFGQGLNVNASLGAMDMDYASTGFLGTNPITTVNTSTSVTVAHTAHGRIVGDTVTFLNATAINNVTLNGTYKVVTVPDGNSYTVTALTTANASSSGGGSTIFWRYSQAKHRNNVMFGMQGGSGWTTPIDTTNLAGWVFDRCGTSSSNTPTGKMHVKDLPGNFTNDGYHQDGPIEAQEYCIIDCSVSAPSNFGVSIAGAVGGFSGDVKVRYNGTAWTISG